MIPYPHLWCKLHRPIARTWGELVDCVRSDEETVYIDGILQAPRSSAGLWPKWGCSLFVGQRERLRLVGVGRESGVAFKERFDGRYPITHDDMLRFRAMNLEFKNLTIGPYQWKGSPIRLDPVCQKVQVRGCRWREIGSERWPVGPEVKE